MSGFFGIFRPQGGPVDLEAFEQMKTAMYRDGFDGMETHVEEKIAMGHLMLRVSPESKYDKQPLKSSCGNYLLVGHFRLDYRDELGDKLGLTQSQLEVTPDSQLALLAYQKWNEKCVHHLEGDWAFVVFSIIENKLVAFKDCIGHSTIFYSIFRDGFIFSTSIKLLIPKIGLEEVVNLTQLKLLSLNHCELSEGLTLFKGIFVLKNAHQLSVDYDLLFCEKKYWDLRKVPCLRYHFEEDVVADLTSIYSNSISTRIKSKDDVGLFLSSGLDSTSIAYFASVYFSFYSKILYTYTSYPQYISEIPDNKIDKAREDILVKNFVEGNKNIESYCLNFKNKLISEEFISGELDNYDPIIISNTFWINGLLKNAKQKGCKIILCGQLGNASLTWSAPYLTFSKLINFKFKFLLNRIVVMSKKYNVTIFTVLWHEILIPLKNLLRNKLHFSSFRKSIFKSSIFKSNSFKDEFNLRQLGGLQYIPGYTFFLSDEEFRYAFLSKVSNKAGSKWYTLGQDYGIETTDPTSDIRLLEFTFRISEDYFNYFGDSKYIFKKMMNGRLPEYILNKKVPSVQAYDIGLRIINDANFPQLLKDLTFEKSNMYNLDTSLVSSQYNELLNSSDLAKKFRISNILLKNLSILNFISKKS